MNMKHTTLPLACWTHWSWWKVALITACLLPASALQSAGFYAAIDHDAVWLAQRPQTTEQQEVPFFAEAAMLDEANLETLRGGFSVSGMDLHFGAVLKTQIDSMVLESIINIDQSGARLTSQMLNGADIGSLPGDIQAKVVGAGASINDVAPGSLKLTGLKDFSGLALSDSKGFTAALHNITKQAIVSAVVSDASQRSVQQTIDININVGNMPALRSASQRQAILNSLAR
ncbi:hypothetical protein IEI94_14345 [Halomonas sp. ML-15]|uniref:hypothetical protein n=1 Tax=Halomonas sp. ML-15 TaxID=2773305 RepID=UPI001746F235|nr:hypothetical protein [Halomonas sp. ML-15]MBD3897034.1 hypothetical protein [Halomonas sp. ML-15]